MLLLMGQTDSSAKICALLGMVAKAICFRLFRNSPLLGIFSDFHNGCEGEAAHRWHNWHQGKPPPGPKVAQPTPFETEPDKARPRLEPVWVWPNMPAGPGCSLSNREGYHLAACWHENQDMDLALCQSLTENHYNQGSAKGAATV